MIRPLLVAALLAAPVPAMALQDDQFVCSASAKGSRGAHVDVGIHVDADGEVLTRYISWTPPMLEASKPQYPDLGSPGLTLQYDDAESKNIGALTGAIGDASSLGGPDGALRRLTLWVLVDGGDQWTAELDEFQTEVRAGGGRFRYASSWITDAAWDGDPIESLEKAPAVMLSLRDTAGRPVAQARYNLAAKAERDRLFRSAWRKAETMVKNPKRCDKTGDETGDEEPVG